MPVAEALTSLRGEPDPLQDPDLLQKLYAGPDAGPTRYIDPFTPKQPVEGTIPAHLESPAARNREYLNEQRFNRFHALSKYFRVTRDARHRLAANTPVDEHLGSGSLFDAPRANVDWSASPIGRELRSQTPGFPHLLDPILGSTEQLSAADSQAPLFEQLTAERERTAGPRLLERVLGYAATSDIEIQGPGTGKHRKIEAQMPPVEQLPANNSPHRIEKQITQAILEDNGWHVSMGHNGGAILDKDNNPIIRFDTRTSTFKSIYNTLLNTRGVRKIIRIYQRVSEK